MTMGNLIDATNNGRYHVPVVYRTKKTHNCLKQLNGRVENLIYRRSELPPLDSTSFSLGILIWNEPSWY